MYINVAIECLAIINIFVQYLTNWLLATQLHSSLNYCSLINSIVGGSVELWILLGEPYNLGTHDSANAVRKQCDISYVYYYYLVNCYVGSVLSMSSWKLFIIPRRLISANGLGGYYVNNTISKYFDEVKQLLIFICIHMNV